MAINPISNAISPNSTRKSRLPVQLTGYGALAAGITSGILAKNKKIKAHRYLAYLTGLLALAHAGIIEYFHHIMSKNA